MKSKSLNWQFLFFTLAVVVLWVGWWFFPMGFSFALSTDKQGQIGDKFGALNTLFTGVALLGLAYSIMGERKARKDGEKDHARQVELAADTARMQALPVLIDLQRERLRVVAASLFPEIERHFMFEDWVRGKVNEWQAYVQLAPTALEELQTARQAVMNQKSYPMRELENLNQRIHDYSARPPVIREALPHLRTHLGYLEDYRLLYEKMKSSG